MNNPDFFGNRKNLKRRLEYIRDFEVLSTSEKKLLLDFYKDSIADGLSVHTISDYMMRLPKIAEWMGEELGKAKKEDIREVVLEIEGNGEYTEHTKHDYKVTLKKFYKWLNDGEYPSKVKWVKTTLRKTRKKLPEELLSREEINKMVRKASNLRDKALISVLYESGCRVGELMKMKVKHINFNKYGAKVTVHGKTGARRILLISSVPHLSNWVQNHPNSQHDTYLWVNIGTVRHGKRMKYNAIRKMLKKTAKGAGIEKRIYPHLFRHSRATHLANKLTEAQMCEYFGWVQGSDQPATYVHLSGRDVDNAILEIHGIKEREEEGEELKVRECPRCGQDNPPEANRCNRCGLVLDVKKAMEKVKQREEFVEGFFRPEKIEKLVREEIRRVLRNGGFSKN